MRIKIQLFPSVLQVGEQSYVGCGKGCWDPNHFTDFSVESDQGFHFNADSDPVFHWMWIRILLLIRLLQFFFLFKYSI